MSGRRMDYRKHDRRSKATTERVVGEGEKPRARVPRNINVRPLQTPPMEPIKEQRP